MAALPFGLDIGRSFIKVVQVKRHGGKKLLTSVFSAATPSGGMVTDSPIELKKISESVKSAVSQAKVEGRQCIVSLIESQTVTRLVQMPNLTDKELAAAINYEADKYIPLPIKEVNLQYKVVVRYPTGMEAGGKMDVLLVAAPKRVVEKYLIVVHDCGLKLAAIETESSATARALASGVEAAVVIVSFGSASTEVVAVRQGSVIFTRSIPTGGDALTRAVMAEFNLQHSQAEQYKHSYGILENQLGGKVASVLKPVLEVIIAEIIRAVDFSKTHMLEAQLARIIIAGGGAYLPGLSEFVTRRTSLEVSLADPWEEFVKEGLILKFPGQGGFYTTATGLAVRG
ncbi:MAG: type IV pilus assembly protein PilM, nonfunctional [Candidatus Curtissbacteria bacterium GW2011_GWA1_40_9]|uniref:Type IV pilus assembly protein PilM, nonfunctional n=1 Tax=Candidatus Curtissbacteria bacterium GW2011_GWA1_40_9 TaxID=1618408 RepID=A0A0G0W1Y6_9BACT|nr:MAG: type IV pilus assembly protein PilM, nonfunctional [Candidatus Curtissbacteria bacterium GW2011_GWA1_40_9]